MPLDKLPVPTLAELQLQTTDVGSVFQGKMNAAVIALRNALMAYNNQIDAALTASQQVEPAPFDVAVAGENNSYKMTPLRVRQVMDNVLGTASKLTATTNTADVSTGRALRVADHGFGTTFRGRVDVLAGQTPAQVLAIYGSAGTAFRYDGTIINHGGATPEPWGVLSGFITDGNAYSYSWQEFTGIYGNRYRRVAAGPDAWTVWGPVYDGRNVVGPVTFSGGANTGAIIERGANSNGEFVAFADGTVIAWGRVIATGQAINPASNGNGTTGYLCDPVMPTNLIGRVISLGQHTLYDSADRLVYSIEAASSAGLPFILNLGSRPDASWPYLNALGTSVAVKVDYTWTAIGRWR